MIARVFYIIFGTAVVGLVAAAELSGWSPTSTEEVRGVPRSVRSNPGAYRAIYVGSGRYRRGK